METIAISIKGAASALGIGRTKIYDLIRQGRLVALKIGRRTLITTVSIRDLAECCALEGEATRLPSGQRSAPSE